jgi:cytoskeletal protein CcmA (bactofilin family)
MFKQEARDEKRPRGDDSGSTTIVGSGTSFNGVLKVNGALRVDGEVEGQVYVTQNLVVGAGGVLKAEIVTDSAVVTGRVIGRIQAKGKVELQKGSRLEGDVHAHSFQIEDGAFFQGNCAMGEAAASAGRGKTAGGSGENLKVVGP